MIQLEIIVILQGNIDLLHLEYLIYDKTYLKNFMQLFIMDQTMIIILP